MIEVKQEEWRNIDGYEYEISNTGQVRNKTGKIMHQSHNTYGYLHVSLCKMGYAKTVCVHKLVACAFIANPNGYPQINHKDGNKENNAVSNLEWCTQKQNNQHACQNNLRKCKHISMLKDNNVIKTFNNRMEIEQFFGRKLCQDLITRVCNGERSHAYGYEWRYE